VVRQLLDDVGGPVDILRPSVLRRVIAGNRRKGVKPVLAP
jgi:hypothetical protein